MKKQRSDNFGILSAGIVVGLVVTSLLLWALQPLLNQQIIAALVPAAGALILAVFAAVILSRKYREVKKGFPAQDERTKKVFIYAGYKTFLISLYWLLAISFAEDYKLIAFRDIQQAIGASLIGMAIIFGLSYLWINRSDVDF